MSALTQINLPASQWAAIVSIAAITGSTARRFST
jgi:hypothetical protein